jgi:pyrroloquinoline quinone (PQQ) biosynthesis protein C
MDQDAFESFVQRIKNELFTHVIITDNLYCKWFADAELTKSDVIEFTKQFSVFSNQFPIAQLNKVINAGSLEEMHDAKEILLNELGVSFKKDSQKIDKDVQYGGIEGSIEDSKFKFQFAHFEWLLAFAEPLGLGFNDIGKRSHGSLSTLFFCDELIRLYGSENNVVGAGASFAVENWAAAGFWKQLIQGLENFNESNKNRMYLSKELEKGLRIPPLKLGFFVWHDKIEEQHASHTWHELEELYFNSDNFDEDTFITSGLAMLDGVKAFWDGLNLRRIVAQHER